MEPIYGWNLYQLDDHSNERIIIHSSIVQKVASDHKIIQDELNSLFISAQDSLTSRSTELSDKVPDWDSELREFYVQFTKVIADRQFEVFQLFAMESADAQDGALARIQSIIDQSLDNQTNFFEQTMHMPKIHKIEERHAHTQKRLSDIFKNIQDSLEKTVLLLLNQVVGVSTPERLRLLQFYDDSIRLITAHKTNAFRQFVARTIEAQDNTLAQIQSLAALALDLECGFIEQMEIAQNIMQETDGEFPLVQLTYDGQDPLNDQFEEFQLRGLAAEHRMYF